MRDEIVSAADAARGPAQRDWGGFLIRVFAMICVAAAVLGGIWVYQTVDLRDLAFRKPVETESVTDRAARIADRLRRPEDTVPKREPLAIDLAAERAAAAQEQGPAEGE